MYITDLQDNDLEIAIKVVIVGNGAVGKSSMIQRYCRGVFTKSYKKTIGVDFLEKQMRILSEDVRLMLWDTAGQEEFDAITKAYYRGAQACVVAFSTVDRASFEAVKKWKKKVEDECGGSSIPMVLVQNKIDLMHQAVVSSEEAENLAKECNMRLYRTSVKEDINICNVFQHLAENYVNQVKSSYFFHANRKYYDMRSPSTKSNSANSTSSNSSNNSSSPDSLLEIGCERLCLTYDDNEREKYRANRYSNNGFNNARASRYSTPQEYLDNPMFASLNNRKYWINDRTSTIVLKPLSSLTRKRNLHRKFPIKSGCKVL